MADPEAPPARPHTRPTSGVRRWWQLVSRASSLSLGRQVGLGAAVYAGILLVLVVLGISGSSMGLLHGLFSSGDDARLLLGSPRPIRSDEWLVVAPLTVAQVDQGLPRFSELFPGGFDASIVWDLPYREWTVLLRPHMWGFFGLPLDNAFALKWWLPFLAMAFAAYTLLTVLWRRPLASFAVAGAFVASPFFQWWFGSGSFWPPTAAIAACVAIVLMLRTDRARIRWLLAAVVGYLVLVAVVALYPPFLVPSFYAAIGFGLGWLFAPEVAGLAIRDRLRRLVPLGVAAIAVGVVLLVYLRTRSETVDAVLSTSYPGERLYPPGESHLMFWEAVYAGVFGMGLRSGDLTLFAPNSSEGSSFIFLGLYLLASAGWILWVRWRRHHQIDWPIIGALGSLALLMAYVYVPGWDGLAHLLFLDRTALPRVFIGVGIGAFLLLALVVARLMEMKERIPLWTTAVAVTLVAVNHIAVYLEIKAESPAVLDVSTLWPVLAVLLLLGVALLSRGQATAGGLVVAVVALGVAGWVNPLYRGVLDQGQTDLLREIEEIEAQDPGSWVAVGGLGSTAVLRETGVVAYSGVQGWPSDEMWAELDPDGSDEDVWNRYAHVNWIASAEEDITLVQPDVVQVRFDSCADFEQETLDYVVSDAPIDQECVAERAVVPQGTVTYYVYDVVSRTAG